MTSLVNAEWAIRKQHTIAAADVASSLQYQWNGTLETFSNCEKVRIQDKQTLPTTENTAADCKLPAPESDAHPCTQLGAYLGWQG